MHLLYPYWIIPTDIDWIVTEYCQPTIKFLWYDTISEADEPWKRAGRRGLGNTDIMKNSPARCRIHYDSNLQVNVIGQENTFRIRD